MLTPERGCLGRMVSVKTFEAPDFEMIHFDAEDVIVTSTVMCGGNVIETGELPA